MCLENALKLSCIFFFFGYTYLAIRWKYSSTVRREAIKGSLWSLTQKGQSAWLHVCANVCPCMCVYIWFVMVTREAGAYIGSVQTQTRAICTPGFAPTATLAHAHTATHSPWLRHLIFQCTVLDQSRCSVDRAFPGKAMAYGWQLWSDTKHFSCK